MTKLIDIHTQGKTKGIERKPINPELVKKYVFENLENLPEIQWNLIESEFSDIWNNKLGRGGYFYWDELTTWIFDALRQKKILIEFERVDKVVNLILKYIDENGGFLE